MVDRVAAALRLSCDSVIMIANDPGAQEWVADVPVMPDVHIGAAALGGIHAALARSGTDVIVVAWDLPFVPAGLLSELRRRGRESDAVLPAGESRRRLEPLCAFYSQACLAPIERAVAAGDKRPIAFHQKVRLTVMSIAELSQFGDPGILFMNVNTPEDFELANAIATTLEKNDADGETER